MAEMVLLYLLSLASDHSGNPENLSVRSRCQPFALNKLRVMPGKETKTPFESSF